MGIKHTYTNKEKPTFELIPAGIYAAEVRKFDTGISSGQKTAGSDQMELMFTIYKDDTFADDKKLSALRDTIIFHELTDWKADAFATSFNIASKPGEGIEFDEALCLGCRGWVKIKVEDYKNAAGEKKQSNKIDDYPTNKPRLPKFVAEEEWE